MRHTAEPPASSDLPHFFDRHDGHALKAEQLRSETCIICGAADGPMEPAGFGARGQLFRHASCAGDSYRMRRHRDAINALRPALTGPPQGGEFP